ncbi:universal stress protein [Allobranchiibius sp. CTAmp26]|uniref:universal stress protein n=1 Tax=Allobranchiibius sp. CTAmp26 TaxID=2815214 RepID=UPI001AA0EE7E|nr:universal stress protein [Allobranchiibius sp. CTAmp26]MBO1756637.1 universal stress protein [Allobranchiibius sp. CTAmp26]
MNIVVGYIPSPEGLAAIDHAMAMAKLGDERIVVLNCGTRGNDADKSFAEAADWDAVDQKLTSMGLIHEMRQPAQARTPADEILGAAADIDADLIVIGIRRRSPVGKLIAGSTSQQVLLEAECAVLAVKQPPTAS